MDIVPIALDEDMPHGGSATDYQSDFAMMVGDPLLASRQSLQPGSMRGADSSQMCSNHRLIIPS
ncbi:hypothetical protein NLM33_38340 [Bradyrhizobium sp. CCGUVB1N3]|uniref:hypothetical protein n=1 Tax=Bradyrhizobium sp. CCGUVB1N3 TaxID=2949629 RepID=UPI0020B1FFCF|nr:hypothetical protein [Bradyrhizobium sp. CCGUVB1N3]MCP3476092.1 hypothetical protein [Bradyrhizobium sp. CCGUVB1N3]